MDLFPTILKKMMRKTKATDGSSKDKTYGYFKKYDFKATCLRQSLKEEGNEAILL